jgi:hypothetical protein
MALNFRSGSYQTCAKFLLVLEKRASGKPLYHFASMVLYYVNYTQRLQFRSEGLHKQIRVIRIHEFLRGVSRGIEHNFGQEFKALVPTFCTKYS